MSLRPLIVGIKLNTGVLASHFSHLGVKGDSVAGRLCQGGGTGEKVFCLKRPKLAFSGRARRRAAVFTEGLPCGR